MGFLAFNTLLRALIGALAVLLLGACAAGTHQSANTLSPDPLARVEAEQLFHHGQALAAHGDLVRAEQYLAAAIKRGYPQAKALPLLLRVCIAASRLGAALQHATPYLQQHPDDHRLRSLVASVLIGLGRHDEAQRELQRVLLIAPHDAGTHYRLGALLRDHYGDLERAAQHFAAHQAHARDSLHGAEVAAWLREHHGAAETSPRAQSLPEAAP